MFEKELNFFVANQEKLVEQYQAKTLVIRDNEILAVFDTPLQAYLNLQSDGQLGKAMIQVCAPGPEAYTLTIN